MSEPVAGVVSRAELVRLRADVRATAGAAPQLDLPPGEDEPLDHVVSTHQFIPLVSIYGVATLYKSKVKLCPHHQLISIHSLTSMSNVYVVFNVMLIN